VGRTGTFIAIDNILEQIEEQKVVDVPSAITKIRQRRMKMVQTHVTRLTFFGHDDVIIFV
jgi:protein tyrosine phosphatase